MSMLLLIWKPFHEQSLEFRLGTQWQLEPVLKNVDIA